MGWVFLADDGVFGLWGFLFSACRASSVVVLRQNRVRRRRVERYSQCMGEMFTG